MIAKLSARRKLALGAGLALLVLAQAGGTSSYNLGVPTVPGTRTPESNPATAVTPPAYGNPATAPGSGSANSSTGTPTTATPGSSGPAYSFGAAPPPVVAPGSGR
jgi:hypothetical protein